MEYQPGVSPNHSASASYLVEARDYLDIVEYLQNIFPGAKKNNLLRIALLAGRQALFAGETYSEDVEGVTCYFTGLYSGAGGWPASVESYVAGHKVSFWEIAEKINIVLFGQPEGPVSLYIQECIFLGAVNLGVKMLTEEDEPFVFDRSAEYVDTVKIYFDDWKQIVDAFLSETKFEIDEKTKLAIQGALLDIAVRFIHFGANDDD